MYRGGRSRGGRRGRGRGASAPAVVNSGGGGGGWSSWSDPLGDTPVSEWTNTHVSELFKRLNAPSSLINAATEVHLGGTALAAFASGGADKPEPPQPLIPHASHPALLSAASIAASGLAASNGKASVPSRVEAKPEPVVAPRPAPVSMSSSPALISHAPALATPEIVSATRHSAPPPTPVFATLSSAVNSLVSAVVTDDMEKVEWVLDSMASGGKRQRGAETGGPGIAAAAAAAAAADAAADAAASETDKKATESEKAATESKEVVEEKKKFRWGDDEEEDDDDDAAAAAAVFAERMRLSRVSEAASAAAASSLKGAGGPSSVEVAGHALVQAIGGRTIDPFMTHWNKAASRLVEVANHSAVSRALCRACEVGAGSSVIRALLEAGAAPTYHDESGFTPLLHAVARGDAWLAELLLDAGASPDSVVPFRPRPNTPWVHRSGLELTPGDTVLVVAVSTGLSAIVAKLLPKTANKPDGGLPEIARALMAAIEADDVATFRVVWYYCGKPMALLAPARVALSRERPSPVPQRISVGHKSDPAGKKRAQELWRKREAADLERLQRQSSDSDSGVSQKPFQALVLAAVRALDGSDNAAFRRFHAMLEITRGGPISPLRKLPPGTPSVREMAAYYPELAPYLGSGMPVPIHTIDKA